MMLQLNPPLPIETPKGKAWAIAMIDYGPQWEILWVTFIKETGECWTFRNSQIRQGENYTFSNPQPSPIEEQSPPLTVDRALDSKVHTSRTRSMNGNSSNGNSQSN